MGNWVFADAVLTGYRAHVESTAASPELVRGKWKVQSKASGLLSDGIAGSVLCTHARVD